MNELKEMVARMSGWKKCAPPKWFDEFRLRQKICFPPIFRIKGKTFKYKAFKKHPEEQGNSLIGIYNFYCKKRTKN